MSEHLEACILAVKARGESKESAIRICQASVEDAGEKASLEDVMAKAMSLTDHKKKKPKTQYSRFAELKGVEILRAGVIRGKKIGIKQLDEFVENTNRVISEGVHNPPFKLGHDDDQEFAKLSGLPATGWLEKVRRVGSRVLGDFADVPELVAQAIKKRLFDKVSAEVYFDIPHPRTGEILSLVARAVAILGADVPELKGMVPLRALMSELTKVEDKSRVVFAAEAMEKATWGMLDDVVINIHMPGDKPAGDPVIVELPEDEPTIIDGPVPLDDPDSLEGEDLDLFREAEEVAKNLQGSGIRELFDQPTVEGLVRFVGRDGGGSLRSNPMVPPMTKDVEVLVSWLRERAAERGLLQLTEKTKEKGDTDMIEATVTKLEEELKTTKSELETATKGKTEAETKLVEATKKAEAEAVKLVETRKVESRKGFEAFCEKNKEYIVPAVKPAAIALHDLIVNEGEQVLKLTDNTEKKIDAVELLQEFITSMIDAKRTKFGETAKTGSKGSEVEGGEGKYSELDAAAKTLMASDARFQERLRKGEKEHVVYMDAVKAAAKADPSLKEEGGE